MTLRKGVTFALRSSPRRPSGRLLLLGAVAALMSASALLAIGILLFGDFGETEGRILATTALVAAYSLLALPAAVLRDQGRLAPLAATVAVLALLGASLSIAATWAPAPPDALGKAMGTVTAWLVASVQVAALAAWRAERRGSALRRLFALSSLVAFVLAAMLSAIVWAEIDSEGIGRVFGALAVLDVLLVALQPVVARARRAVAFELTAVVAPNERVVVHVEAEDLPSAAAKAIRRLERAERRVLRLELPQPLPDAPALRARRANNGSGEPRPFARSGSNRPE
jgi:MFS family permease